MGEDNQEPDPASQDHPDNQKMVHDGWKDLKEKKRGCTDCLFLLLLIAAWVAMTAIGFVACGAIKDENLPAGNPNRLTNAMDYNGDICGYDTGVKNKPYAYYLPDRTAVCVKKCPRENDVYKFICRYEKQDYADASTVQGYEQLAQFNCMYQIKTKSYIHRCLPDTDIAAVAQLAATASNGQVDSSQASYATDAAAKGKSWFNAFISDFMSLRGYIFGFGIGVTVGVAFLYLYLLRIPGFLFLVLWGMICGIFVFLIVGSWLLWSLANTWSADGDHSDGEVAAIRVFAYFGMAVTVLYFCLMVVLRKRIQLAIGIVKQSARALAAMPTLTLLPVIQATVLVIFLVPWVIYVLYLASSGDITTITVTQGAYTYSYRAFSYSTNTRYAFLYMLFIWFWTSEFIIACGQLIISLSFACWYFTRDKSTIGPSTVQWAFRVTAMYHMGTAAFGSLIIAIIKTIRVVIAYLQKKAKKSKNRVLQFILCILQCMMWCLEKIMKFINKHAYIITAIYGYSFCPSARKAFFLLLRNILRVAAVNMVAGFLLFVGKLFIPLATTFLCYLAMAYATNNSEMNGIMGPLVFTFLLSYWVGSMFVEIFGMGIETILFSYIADEEMFKPEDRFAEAELMSTIQKTAQAAAAAKAKVGVEPEPIKVDETQIVTKQPPAPGDAVF